MGRRIVSAIRADAATPTAIGVKLSSITFTAAGNVGGVPVAVVTASFILVGFDSSKLDASDFSF